MITLSSVGDQSLFMIARSSREGSVRLALREALLFCYFMLASEQRERRGKLGEGESKTESSDVGSERRSSRSAGNINR
jgi:hypothetical protein